MAGDGVGRPRGNDGAVVGTDDVERREQRSIDGAAPRFARGGRRDAEWNVLDPGVAGDVEIAVVFALGLASIQAESQRAADMREVGSERLDAVPDHVRAQVALGAS